MQKLIVANYKMNGNKKFYVSAFKKLNNTKVKDTKIVLCPPFVYLDAFKIKNKNISLGAQDVSMFINNKSTGQISPLMLKEFNVSYAIVGHSEQRELGLTNEQVANKAKLCINNGITPIVCVGEINKKSDVNFVVEQVKSALSLIEAGDVIFAYEPLWAIGSGLVPTVDHINKASKIIKDTCNSLGFVPVVLYGGSVDDNNFKELIKSNIDGFLVGGASLNTDKFINLIRGVDNE